jgi:two-component system C4-dicarboxylate transport sensor histidine kinase DctB
MHDILDSMKEGVLVTDLVGQVTYSNVVAQRLLNAAATELLGVHVADLITARWELQEGSLRARGEGLIRLADRERQEVVVERCQLCDQRGMLQGMVYTLEDVTERAALMRALADHRDMLARSERIAAVGTMGAIIAHKFSQPLSSVRLFLQQVRRELTKVPVPEQVHSTLADALSELDRIAHLTRQIVQPGRTQPNHRGGGESEVAQLNSALVRVVESLRDAALRRGVVLCPDHIDPAVTLRCAPIELEEILYCLINNSIQAAPEGSPARVGIGFSTRESMGIITVSDSCGGIASEHIDKIFECFFTTKQDDQGTGLGLAILRHVVERRGGRVDLVNEVGVGSCFTISIPMAQELCSTEKKCAGGENRLVRPEQVVTQQDA